MKDNKSRYLKKLSHASKENKYVENYSLEFSLFVYKYQTLENALLKMYQKSDEGVLQIVLKVLLNEMCSSDDDKKQKYFKKHFNNLLTVMKIRNKLVHSFFVDDVVFAKLNEEELKIDDKIVKFSNEDIMKNFMMICNLIDDEIGALKNFVNLKTEDDK